MAATNQIERYGGVMQALHWVVALLVFVQLAMGKFGEVEPAETGASLFIPHASLGFLVLVLMLARVFWRVTRPQPAAFPMPAIHQKVMALTHLGFYGLLVLLPLSGWALASAGGADMSLFGVLPVPALPVGQGEETKDLFEEIHEVLGTVVLILAALHVLATLKHQLIDKDGLLRRMLPH